MERIQTKNSNSYAKAKSGCHSRSTQKSTAVTIAETLADYASEALTEELATYPKPGMVSFMDNGSHPDMNADTFLASIAALRPYFYEITLAGYLREPFRQIRHLGIQAEAEMLKATGGINTHKGALFSLGLICAAAGTSLQRDGYIQSKKIGSIIQEEWAYILLQKHEFSSTSNGNTVYKKHGINGARAEAAYGFPHVYKHGLPALRKALTPKSEQAAWVQCFFDLLAVVDDTTLIHRGGMSGLTYARNAANEFIKRGGVSHPEWRSHALHIHREFVKRNLTAGGVADLLAASLLIHKLEGQL